MAQTGYTPIQLYRSVTLNAVPVTGNLAPGELAFNINDADMAMYAENASGVVKRLINNPAGLKYPTADGTAGQVVYTDGAGTLAFLTPLTATSTATLTNKTIAYADNTLTGVVGLAETQTLTNKTITYADNTLTGVVGVTATQTLTNKTLTSPTTTNIVFDGSYTEDVYAIVDGASVDLNPANGTIQTWTLGASRTATATSFAAGQSMTVMINDGTAYTLTWPTTTWVGGVAPTLATSGYTVVELWKVGATLYGAFVGNVA